MAAQKFTPEQKSRKVEYERERRRNLTPAQRERKRKSDHDAYEANLEKNREYAAAKQRRLYKTHPEMARENSRKYRIEHPEAARAATKKWKDANKDYCTAWHTKWNTLPRNRLGCLVTMAKKRAKHKGIEFEESIRDALKDAPALVCCCCNSPLDYSRGRGLTDRARAPSLDRVHNTEGYTVENVRIICYRCNILKRDATLAELEFIVAYMRAHQKPAP